MQFTQEELAPIQEALNTYRDGHVRQAMLIKAAAFARDADAALNAGAALPEGNDQLRKAVNSAVISAAQREGRLQKGSRQAQFYADEYNKTSHRMPGHGDKSRAWSKARHAMDDRAGTFKAKVAGAARKRRIAGYAGAGLAATGAIAGAGYSAYRATRAEKSWKTGQLRKASDETYEEVEEDGYDMEPMSLKEQEAVAGREMDHAEQAAGYGDETYEDKKRKKHKAVAVDVDALEEVLDEADGLVEKSLASLPLAQREYARALVKAGDAVELQKAFPGVAMAARGLWQAGATAARAFRAGARGGLSGPSKFKNPVSFGAGQAVGGAARATSRKVRGLAGSAGAAAGDLAQRGGQKAMNALRSRTGRAVGTGFAVGGAAGAGTTYAANRGERR